MSARGGEPVLECVAFGNGSLASWGVSSHQVGMVGALARSLARRFGRGVNVRGTIDPDLTVHTMLAAAGAADVPWASAHIGIIGFGPGEILHAPRSHSWESDLTALVSDVRDRMPAGSTLAVLGIPPISALKFLHGPGSSVMAREIERYNRTSAVVCAAIEGVKFVPLPDPGPFRPGQYRSAEQYGFWGDLIAAFVALEGFPVPPQPTEAARSRSVEKLRLLDGTLQAERFDRIVRLAQGVFRTTSAAVDVLHENWQWPLARVGGDGDRVPRDHSICAITVDQSAPLVIGDTWADERFDANHPVHEGRGVRFYAGYPLRAPDGNLIGALCVFDPEPREAEDVNVATLRDLALMIEAELSDQRRAS